MKRDVGPLEGDEQLLLIGMQSFEQPVECGKAGSGGEEPLEALLERRVGLRRRLPAVRLEIGIEPPQPRPDPLDGLALPVIEADQLVDQPFGVDPAQRVMADVELTGVVTDDDGIA